MPTAKIAISIEPDALRELDSLVEQGVYPSRSRLIQTAVAEKLRKIRRTRLAEECAKLDPDDERAAAEEWMTSEAPWPEY